MPNLAMPGGGPLGALADAPQNEVSARGAPGSPLKGAIEGGPRGPKEAEVSPEVHAQYLNTLQRMETSPPMKLGLEEIERVSAVLGSPHKKFPAVHVAGEGLGFRV